MLANRRHALLHSGVDHLHDVAPHERDALPHDELGSPLRPRLCGQTLELGRSSDKRSEIKAEGRLDLTPLPFSGHSACRWDCRGGSEATFDEHRQCRRNVAAACRAPAGRTVRWTGTRRQLPVPRERRLGMEGQQRIEDRKARSVDADRGLRFADGAEDLPLMDGIPSGTLSRATCVATMASDSVAAQRASLKDVRSMFPCLLQAKEICSPKRRQNA